MKWFTKLPKMIDVSTFIFGKNDRNQQVFNLIGYEGILEISWKLLLEFIRYRCK